MKTRATSRIKNNGFHDLLVIPDDSEAVFIRHHGKHPASIVISRAILPLLVEALAAIQPVKRCSICEQAGCDWDCTHNGGSHETYT